MREEAEQYQDLDEEEPEQLPANASAGEHLSHAAAQPLSFFSRLTRSFGWRFSVQLAVMYLLVKGVVNSGMALVMLPFCQKTLGVSGENCQTLGAIAATPWALKGAIGVLSDMWPLLGFHKLSYILITAAIGSIAILILAVAPIGSASLAAVLFAGANFQTATGDLLHEARYSELMQAKPKTGSAVVSYVWGLISVGGLVASCFVGPIADNGEPQIVFWVLLPCAVSVVIPTALNYLGDEQVEGGTFKIKWELVDAESSRYPIYLALILALAALLNAMMGLLFFEEKLLQMCVGLAVATVLVLLAHLWLPPTQRSCNLYMFASSMLYINIQGALDYWYTGDDDCVPGGPHFNYTFYVTIAHVAASIASLIGVVVFQAALHDWTFRSLFAVTTVVQLLAGIVDIIIIQRFNLVLGIPDEVAYLGGNAVIRPIVFMTAGLPGIVLTSRLVPAGISSTTYALLAGYQHLGHILSQQIGVAMMQAAGLATVMPAAREGMAAAGDETCEWGHLTLLVLVCHLLLPLLSIPLIYLLIPDKKMTDDVLAAEEQTGSGGKDL